MFDKKIVEKKSDYLSKTSRIDNYESFVMGLSLCAAYNSDAFDYFCKICHLVQLVNSRISHFS